MNLEDPFLTDPKQIKAWLASIGSRRWKINGAGLVDVVGNINLRDRLGPLTKLPVRFGKVSGHFWCHSNQLVSLEGAPEEVGGDFYCDSNQIVSLKGAPKNVGGNFLCYYNQLVSLEGSPKKVGGHFWCDHNLLVDFKGMEDVSIRLDLVVTDPEIGGQDNVFVSVEGLPKELYGSVKGLDIKALLELESKYSEIPDVEI